MEMEAPRLYTLFQAMLNVSSLLKGKRELREKMVISL